MLILVHTRNSFFCELKYDLGTTNWCGERGAILSSMGSAKYKVEKFTGQNDFGLWQLKMRALLVQQGLVEALDGEAKLEKMMADGDKKALLQKAHSAIIPSLGDKVLRQVSKETTAAGVWSKLEGLHMTKSLVNRLYLK